MCCQNMLSQIWIDIPSNYEREGLRSILHMLYTVLNSTGTQPDIIPASHHCKLWPQNEQKYNVFFFFFWQETKDYNKCELYQKITHYHLDHHDGLLFWVGIPLSPIQARIYSEPPDGLDLDNRSRHEWLSFLYFKGHKVLMPYADLLSNSCEHPLGFDLNFKPSFTKGLIESILYIYKAHFFSCYRYRNLSGFMPSDDLELPLKTYQ